MYWPERSTTGWVCFPPTYFARIELESKLNLESSNFFEKATLANIKARPREVEKRRFRRYRVNFPCLVKPRGGRKATALAELQAETLDVSSGGLFFVSPVEWKVGSEIECELRLPLKSFGPQGIGIRCKGKVARIVPQEEGRLGIGATIDHYEFFHLRTN